MRLGIGLWLRWVGAAAHPAEPPADGVTNDGELVTNGGVIVTNGA